MIKSCPFCKSERLCVGREFPFPQNGGGEVYIYCVDCGARGPTACLETNEDLADLEHVCEETDWNVREQIVPRRQMSDKSNTEDFEYVCKQCAEELGGKWPENHAATIHKGVCDICNETKPLTNRNDWIWPGKNHQECWD